MRHLFNTGVGVEHRLDRMVLTSTTAYQHFSDSLFTDQDFSAADIFALSQKQRYHSVSEEIALKSKDSESRWQWTTGLFAMIQTLKTDCPITFYEDGLGMMNGMIGAGLPQNPQISLRMTGEALPLSARFSTPSANIALFHQSTVRLVDGLSATVGLRVDYDHRSLDMDCPAFVPYTFAIAMNPQSVIRKDFVADAGLNGRLRHADWQFLPKASLQYAFHENLGNIYLGVSKGYRSGGYNVQAYSDLSQTAIRRAMMVETKAFSIETINALPLPDAIKQGAIAGMTATMEKITPAAPDLADLAYKPEYTWSYELGSHLNLIDNALGIDVAVYYMKTRNQQLARFADSGMGRVIVNAGKSRSTGVELSLKSELLADRLHLTAGYSLTDAVFTDYNLGNDRNGNLVDYSGNRVPFVPRHNFNFAADFRQPLRHDFFRAVSIGGDLRGAGEVYWDEANAFSQDFYVNLSARLAVELKHNISFEVWGRNLTGARYATFSFESMSKRYAQYCVPRHFGFDLRLHF